MPQPVKLLLTDDVAQASARLLALLLAVENLPDGFPASHLAATIFTEKIGGTAPRTVVEYDLDWRIGIDVPVPIRLTIDPPAGNAGGRAPEAHNMGDSSGIC